MDYCSNGVLYYWYNNALLLYGLWFCIITIIWQYDIGGKKKPDGDGHREQEKEGWSLGGLADFA